MQQKFKFIVKEEDNNLRIDKFLVKEFAATKPEITRSKIQKIIENCNVLNESGLALNNASQKIKTNQQIFVTIEEKDKFDHLEAKNIPYEIIYEDEDLMVINKPAGLTVHPGAGNKSDTLVNALLFTHKNKLSTINGEFRPGIVHRLDKDTSGLMLVAKNDFAHQILSKKLQEKEIERYYLAFIYGAFEQKNGTINHNIKRHQNNRLKMSISQNLGRKAITHYRTIQTFAENFISLVECKLETGRTHQIRVHMEYKKHSLVGDKIYSASRKNAPNDLGTEIKEMVTNFPRQALHSYKIIFEHPRSNKEMEFEIDLPKELSELYKMLRLPN